MSVGLLLLFETVEDEDDLFVGTSIDVNGEWWWCAAATAAAAAAAAEAAESPIDTPPDEKILLPTPPATPPPPKPDPSPFPRAALDVGSMLKGKPLVSPAAAAAEAPPKKGG